MIEQKKMARALLSVSDKTDLIPFARALLERGWTLLSTGGTAHALRQAGLPVTEVSEITGHPEIMEGRVKTLHPAVHAGLLGRREHAGDREAMESLGYGDIDLLAVNLYPFEATIGRPGVTAGEAIEQIDIGGPAMLRAAAKNHSHVWALVDPADYPRVLQSLDQGDQEQIALRRELAAKVFGHTSGYDRAIARFLGRESPEAEGALPAHLTFELDRVQSLRYGENPQQAAAFYRERGATGGLPGMRQLHGKELSFNNLLDVDGALQALAPWADGEEAACAIIKHTTPCGIAVGAGPASAYAKALATDPLSAFGSVVAFNREVDEASAQRMHPNFIEAIVAPGFSEAAIQLLQQKKNLRLLELADQDAAGLDLKRVRGGFLVQERLPLEFTGADWRVVTERQPTAAERSDLDFAWRAVAAVKSNAILIARDGAAIGIGAGQMSRVDSSRIAVLKAQENGFDLQGAVLASDAFFPFRDGVDAAAAAGVRAIIQPGGSVRDEEVIAAADEHGIAMIFTGQRLFRH